MLQVDFHQFELKDEQGDEEGDGKTSQRPSLDIPASDIPQSPFKAVTHVIAEVCPKNISSSSPKECPAALDLSLLLVQSVTQRPSTRRGQLLTCPYCISVVTT